MPASPSRQFAEVHPELHVAFQTSQGRALLSDFHQEYLRLGRLPTWNVDQAVRVLGDRAFENPSAGADAWDALHVANGQYSVSLPGDPDAMEFLIYTVGMGSMAGKRVVKIQDSRGPGGYRAIAFLSPTGEFQLWARYRRNARSKRFSVAKALINHLSEEAGLAPEGTTFTLNSGDIAHIFSFTPRCVVCNSPVTADTRIACIQHWPTAEEASPARSPRNRLGPFNRVEEVAVIPEESRCQRSEQCSRNFNHSGRCNRYRHVLPTPETVQHREPVIVIGDFRIQRTNDFLMCEVGTGMVR